MSPAGNKNNVANKLRAVRTEKRLTQEMLGEMVGLTRQSIIAIEKGRFTPSIHTVLMFARALETPIEELFWLQNE